MELSKPTYEELERRVAELEIEVNKIKNIPQQESEVFTKQSQFLENNREYLFKKILETTPYTFVVKDENSVYVEANRSFCEFLGKKEEEIIGKTDYDFFPANEAEQYIKGDKAVMAGEPHEKEEWEVLGSSGFKWLKVAKTPIYKHNDDKKSIGILCSVTDISEQKKTEQSLIESEKKLRELNVLKDNFFSIIGHDLRTPISNIIGFTELLTENIENYNKDKIKEFLKIILSSANKSFLLLSDLLEWSLSQSNKVQIYRESINLNKIISNVLDLNSENISVKNIKSTTNCKEDLFVVTDKYILSTVLRNLITNAIKFSNRDGNITISCFEKVLKNDKVGVEIVVEDTGVGMSLESLNRLFKIDRAISTKGTNGEEGTGLGLILCKEFINKLGGKIKVESELGKGSRFIVTLFNEL